MKNKIRVAVLGSTGYVGMELVKILSKHPYVDINFLGSETIHGSYLNNIDNTIEFNQLPLLKPNDSFNAEDSDYVFLALPHAVSNKYVKKYFDKIIYTDISKDGTLKGVNILQTKKFAKSIEIPIIASGGISNINNVQALHDLRDIGISGVIIGKAIYEKKFDLNKLIKLIGN